MNKRTFIALLLTALVIVVTPLLFPSKPTPRPDSVAAARDTLARDTASRGAGSTTAPAAAPASAPSAPVAAAPAVRAETTTVEDEGVRYAYTSAGAAPLAVTLSESQFHTLRRDRPRAAVSLETPRGPLLHYRIVSGRDTIALDTIPFTSRTAGNTVAFTSTTAPQIVLQYATAPDGYVVHVNGSVAGAAPNSQVLVALPSALRSAEADTLDDVRHLSYGYKPLREDVKSVGFGNLDSTQFRTDSGPMRWVSLRNKYFLLALVAPQPTSNFLALRMRGGQHVAKVAATAEATAIAPITNGTFTFDLYAGPQSWEQLRKFGNDLENVHPYAGWLHGMVQPFSTIVMRILLWLKATLGVNYGWVLIIFGVLVRLLLWPLNQSAMRNSMKMQRLQPEMAEIQKKYKADPEKQREMMMKVYRDHDMSPFSPILGCLPMLLPMPVLFALYFVFQNTIEFRGVSFLWLPDLALKDPTFITPIFMGLSMLVLSWIGLRGVPPNPQSKMMAYMMPAMMTVMFLNFPSGLNLYYAIQNVAAMPQQLLLSRERAKTGTATAPAPKPASATGGGRRSTG